MQRHHVHVFPVSVIRCLGEYNTSDFIHPKPNIRGVFRASLNCETPLCCAVRFDAMQQAEKVQDEAAVVLCQRNC